MSILIRTFALMMLIFSNASSSAALNSESSEQSDELKAQQKQNDPKRFRHSLSGLYSIEDIHYSPLQPYTDFEALYKSAHQAQQELSNICKTTSMLSNTQAEIPQVKSEKRALQKIKHELNNQSNRITDLARASIIANDIESLVTAYEVLNRETRIIKVKNRFKKPAPSGYRDLNILVELPESKMIAEVQLHLQSIAEVKSGDEHDIYEKIQGIERNAITEKRELTIFEKRQMANLRNQSQRLYQQAWQPYITTNIKAA